MKIKKLLPIMALATFALTACPGGTKDKCTVKVDNKDDMVAEWRVGDAARTLTLSITKNGEAGNPLQEAIAGNLKVTASKEGIVTITQFTITPIKAGDVTLTVSYGDAKEALDITIKNKMTAQEKYGTVHAGTEEDPFDNEDAFKVGQWTVENGNTTEAYYIKGKVNAFYHAPGSRTDGAVSYYLEAKSGKDADRFEVYKCYKEGTGEASYLTDDDIWKGAEVLAHGVITNYGATMETTTAIFDRVTGGDPKPAARQTLEKSFADTLAAGKALSDGDSSYNYYKFEAYVVVKAGADFWVAATDVSGTATAGDAETMIELYAPGEAHTAKLTKGAKVTITMELKNYHGTVENNGTIQDITVVTAGSDWDAGYTGKGTNVEEPLTVSEAVALATEKGIDANNDFLDAQLYLTGTVVVDDSHTSTVKSGRASFYVTDGTNTIYVYNMNDSDNKATFTEAMAAGKEVVIAGTLKFYNVLEFCYQNGVADCKLISIK